jgi:hypothetical protein
MKKTLFTLLAAVTLTAAVAPASAQFYDPYEGRPRRVERYYEPPPRYREERRESGYGFGRGCNAVKGTFCWVSRPRPLGANCSCPKDGGVREGYIDR